MAENEFEFFDDDNQTGNAGTTAENTGPKALREAYNKQKTALDEALKELNTYRTEKRTATVADALAKAGIPAKLASTIPAEKPVEEWIAEFGDVFGVQPKGAEQPSVEQAQVAQDFARLASTEQGSDNTHGAPDPAREALLKAAAEGGTRGIEEFMRGLNK